MEQSNAMQSEFEQILEQDSDEPRLPAAAASHLRRLSRCCIPLGRSRSDSHWPAREWGADEPAPPAHLWLSLRAQLESEGLIRDSRVARPTRLGRLVRLGWRSALVRRRAYACCLLAAVLWCSSDPLSRRVRNSPSVARAAVSARFWPLPLTAEDSAAPSTATCKQVMASLPEQTLRWQLPSQHNLGIVDNLIAVCEKSVREQPDDPMAREYLYGAYQQKAVLLATAMDRSTLEDR